MLMSANHAFTRFAHEIIPPQHVECFPQVGTQLVGDGWMPYVSPYVNPFESEVGIPHLPSGLTCWDIHCVFLGQHPAIPHCVLHYGFGLIFAAPTIALRHGWEATHLPSHHMHSVACGCSLMIMQHERCMCWCGGLISSWLGWSVCLHIHLYQVIANWPHPLLNIMNGHVPLPCCLATL